MKIQEITCQMGNDFHAIMVCEHCGGTQKITTGYFDTFYHAVVIPEMLCVSCGKKREIGDEK